MNLLVRLSLFLDILLDLFFVSMQSHGVDIVAAGPELAAPEKLLDLRMSQENLLCGDTFRDLGNLGGLHHGYGLDQKVDMVFIGSYFDKVEFIGWSEFYADFLEGCFHGPRKHLPSILCRTNQMVQETVDIVSFPYVFCHTESIPWLMLKEHPRAELRGNLFDYMEGEKPN